QKDIELETQVLESKMLYVYPNPMTANTKLQFITDLKSEIGINLSIYDEFGRILYRAENYLLDPFENSINMDSELNQGVYFIDIQSENIRLIERFQVIK
ncbi:MAG: T9SS type A sorting domain-containing protein, partial [Bacteroidota bacterium]